MKGAKKSCLCSPVFETLLSKKRSLGPTFLHEEEENMSLKVSCFKTSVTTSFQKLYITAFSAISHTDIKLLNQHTPGCEFMAPNVDSALANTT